MFFATVRTGLAAAYLPARGATRSIPSRWNTCARIIMNHPDIRPETEERADPAIEWRLWRDVVPRR